MNVLNSDIEVIANEIALQSIIDYTKEELLTKEQSDRLKALIIKHTKICLFDTLSLYE
jgi:hypothetical protein